MSDRVMELPGATAGQPGRSGFRVSWLLRLPYPIRNMLRRWRGTLGMMVGVGISLGVVMTILGVSQAELDLFTADYHKSGVDLYVVTEGGKLIAMLPGDNPGTIKNGRSRLAQIRSLPTVNTATGMMNWTLERDRPGPKRSDEPVELIATIGVDGDPSLIPNSLIMQSGRWIRRSDEVVLGDKLAKEKGLGIGDTLRLSGRDFTVVGIGKLRSSGWSNNAIAYLDYRAFRQRAGIGDVFNTILVDASDPAIVRQRIDDIGTLTVYSPDDLVREAEKANASAVVMRWIMVGLSLTVAALFVSNMLGRSVTERRLEFGTLRAIGVPSRTILQTVAYEALFISLASSIAGMGFSLFLGWMIDATLAPEYGFESLYTADPGLFGIVFALALLLGVIAGLFPARNATRVDPVQVLREA